MRGQVGTHRADDSAVRRIDHEIKLLVKGEFFRHRKMTIFV